MISAGGVADIRPGGLWAVLDIGFSSRAKSCGLLVGDDAPFTATFADAKRRLAAIATAGGGPLNLVIEAPLSVCFNAAGNPTGRSVERLGTQTRYWYVGLGSTVATAALYLVRHLHDAGPRRPVRLFEGFVSYKERGLKSDHLLDVRLLREVVDDPARFAGSIIPPESLKLAADDRLASAFAVAGLDCGIPPVIVRSSIEDRRNVDLA